MVFSIKYINVASLLIRGLGLVPVAGALVLGLKSDGGTGLVRVLSFAVVVHLCYEAFVVVGLVVHL